MIGDAIVKMFSALRNQKFRLDTGFSPFSYFTTIAFHAFINRIKKENKHHAVLNEYRDKVYTDLMLSPDGNGNTYNIYVEPSDDDNYNTSSES
jgi:DNA-directed RNA polymerase specialized sigma24 family protein